MANLNDGTPGASEPGADEGPVPVAAVVGVGCLMAFAGFFAGGMVFVLIAKIVGFFTKCIATEGTPACNWHIFAGIGGVFGMITLPAITIWRLKGGRRS